jgi:hypothetical protein
VPPLKSPIIGGEKANLRRPRSAPEGERRAEQMRLTVVRSVESVERRWEGSSFTVVVRSSIFRYI